MSAFSLGAAFSYFLTRKENVCKMPLLIVFHYPADSPESGICALFGYLAVKALLGINSNWLTSIIMCGVFHKHNMCTCVLCFSSIMNHNNKNLGQSHGQFKVIEEIHSLQFVVHYTSLYNL